MLDHIKELEKHRLDPAKLNLETLVATLPFYFKSRSGDVYQWACIPYQKGWSVNVYLSKERPFSGMYWERYRVFAYPELPTSICFMLLWLLDNEIVSYHQLIELL